MLSILLASAMSTPLMDSAAVVESGKPQEQKPVDMEASQFFHGIYGRPYYGYDLLGVGVGVGVGVVPAGVVPVPVPVGVPHPVPVPVIL